MSSVYTKRLAGGAASSAGALAVVPAGKVWVVLSIVAYDSTGTAGAVLAFASTGQLPIALFRQPAGGLLEYQTWQGRHAMVAGEALTCGISNGSWTFACTGYEFAA
jgi:hypothetical protein